MSIRLMSRFAPLVILIALSAPTLASAQDRPTASAFVEDLGPRFTSNAFLSEKNADPMCSRHRLSSSKPTGGLAPGLPTRSVRRWSTHAIARFSELDEDIVALASGISYTSGPWTLAAQYSPKWVYTREFDALSAELHDFIGVIEGAFKWNNVDVSPTLMVRRRLSDADLAENTRFGAGVSFAWKTSDRSTLKVAPGVTYTLYDASPVAGTNRKDAWVGLDVDHTWTLTPSADLVLSAGAGYNNSSVDGRGPGSRSAPAQASKSADQILTLLHFSDWDDQSRRLPMIFRSSIAALALLALAATPLQAQGVKDRASSQSDRADRITKERNPAREVVHEGHRLLMFAAWCVSDPLRKVRRRFLVFG